jgi:hypothetical protein
MTTNAHGRSLATALWGSALRERPSEGRETAPRWRGLDRVIVVDGPLVAGRAEFDCTWLRRRASRRWRCSRGFHAVDDRSSYFDFPKIMPKNPGEGCRRRDPSKASQAARRASGWCGPWDLAIRDEASQCGGQSILSTGSLVVPTGAGSSTRSCEAAPRMPRRDGRQHRER